MSKRTPKSKPAQQSAAPAPKHRDAFGEPTHPAIVCPRPSSPIETEEEPAPLPPGADYTFTYRFTDREERAVRVRADSYTKAAKLARAQIPALCERHGCALEMLVQVNQWDERTDARDAHAALAGVFGYR